MNFLRSLFSAEKGSISSKRVCGTVGWLCVCAVLLLCAIKQTEAPGMVATVIYASTALLGVDSVTEIWKAKNN